MLNLDRYIFLAAVVGSFFFGVSYEKLSVRSDLLTEQEVQHKIEVERNKAADEVAQKVLSGLSQWKQNTETVVKEMHYETTKPEFYNVCFTDKYISLFNDKQQQARATLTNKPSSKVSN